MAASSSSPDDRRRKSERQSWADMADSPPKPDGVLGAIDSSFFQTLAISPLGHRPTVARGFFLSSRGSGYCRMWGRRMVLEGDGLGFLFLFSDLLGVRLRLRFFRVSRAGPCRTEHPHKTKPECGSTLNKPQPLITINPGISRSPNCPQSAHTPSKFPYSRIPSMKAPRP